MRPSVLLGITSPPGLSPGLTQRDGDGEFMPGEKLRGCPTTSLPSSTFAHTACQPDYIKDFLLKQRLLHVATTVR